MLLEITVRRGSRPPISRWFGSLPITIGRGEDCALIIALSDVSRMHAVLEGDALGNFVVSDAGSSNGVLVGGRRITPGERASLANERNEFRIGDLTIRAQWSSGGYVEEPEPREEPPDWLKPDPEHLLLEEDPPLPPRVYTDADVLRMFRMMEALDDDRVVRTGRGA